MHIQVYVLQHNTDIITFVNRGKAATLTALKFTYRCKVSYIDFGIIIIRMCT